MRKNIRDFDCIREVVEHIYRYGFYSREDFIREGIVGSPRAYDDIIRQLRDLYFMDEEDASILETDTRGKYKCYRFKRDYFGNAADELTAAFGLFAVKDDTIKRILCCLSRAAARNGTTVSNVGTAYYDDKGTDFGPSISRTLNSLSTSGYTIKNKTVHKLNTELVQLLETELMSLYYLSAFFAGAGHPRAVATFLKRTLLRALRFRGLPDPPNAFLFRDNTCGNLFDEQVMYQLLVCCSHHVEAELTMIRQGKQVQVKPVALKIDIKLGRWYLLAVRDEAPVMMRVSNIKQVKKLHIPFDYALAKTMIEEQFQHSYISGKRDGDPVLVEAELKFGGSPLRWQFEREILVGEIVEQDGREYYCAEVNDPTELKPLLREYGPYLRVLPNEMHQLDQELQDEYERMLARYGAVQSVL